MSTTYLNRLDRRVGHCLGREPLDFSRLLYSAANTTRSKGDALDADDSRNGRMRKQGCSKKTGGADEDGIALQSLDGVGLEMESAAVRIRAAA